MKTKIINFFTFSISFLIGIYIFFPGYVVKDIITKNSSINIDSVSATLPFGIGMRNVSFKSAKIDRVYIKPNIKDLILSKTLSLNIVVIKRNSELDIYFSRKQPYKVKIEGENLRGVDISEIFSKVFQKKITAEGLFSIKGELSFGDNDVRTIEGKVKINGSNVTVAGLDISPKLKVGDVRLTASCGKGVIKIDDLVLSGGDIKGKISGDVSLQQQFLESPINLVLDIEIPGLPELKGSRITGTIRQPKIL